MKSTVSIIMATYNRTHFIVEALESIQNQTYKNWECLIIDDGGIDNTKEIIKPILESDARFHYFQRPDTYKKGLPGCRNYGLDIAKGDYIIFFDDDDIVHPLNLEVCLSILTQNEKFNFCNYKKAPFFKKFDYNLIGNNNNNNKYIIKNTDNDLLEKMIMNTIPFSSCSVMWKRDCFKTNVFNEDLMYAEEWECYQRILSTNIKGVIIDKVLYYNRKHKNSNTGQFYINDPIRLNSKKEAILLVVKNLVVKNLLTPSLFNYLASFALSYRDKSLMNDIIKIGKLSYKIKLYLNIKYYLFPIWKIYKRANKKLSK